MLGILSVIMIGILLLILATCGHGMPIFTKRPTPKESGNRNFWMPSDRNTQPTRTRISKIACTARFAQITSVFNAIELSPGEMQV